MHSARVAQIRPFVTVNSNGRYESESELRQWLGESAMSFSTENVGPVLDLLESGELLGHLGFTKGCPARHVVATPRD